MLGFRYRIVLSSISIVVQLDRIIVFQLLQVLLYNICLRYQRLTSHHAQLHKKSTVVAFADMDIMVSSTRKTTRAFQIELFLGMTNNGICIYVLN